MKPKEFIKNEIATGPASAIALQILSVKITKQQNLPTFL
jgi:hypothetical protein